MKRVTAARIAEAAGLHKATVKRWAVREGWPYREAPCAGSPRRLYDVSALPAPDPRAPGRSLPGGLRIARAPGNVPPGGSGGDWQPVPRR